MTLLLLLLLLLLLCFALASWRGAPYLPTKKPQVEAALELLDLKPGERVIDLGCGDGSFLLAAAERGIRGTGYEINPLMYLLARYRTRGRRGLIEVRIGDFWRAEWPPTEGIYVFLITRYMAKLERKLADQKRPFKVASYAFELPGHKPTAAARGVYLYRYS